MKVDTQRILNDRQQRFLDRVIAAIEAETVNVPGPHDLARILVAPHQAVQETLRLGEQVGALVSVDKGIYFTPGQLERIAARLRDATGGEAFDAPRAREILGTTRRFAAPLMEHLDATGVTTRIGGLRTI